MSDFQLKAQYLISGQIELLSGLFIGGTFSPMSIGSPDNTVVRNPLDKKPYIPGSSLKGKMRSLLELRDGTIGPGQGKNVQHGPSQDPNTRAARLFGLAAGNDARPSRLIVRDSRLLDEESTFSETDLPYTESKTEVVLDRISSAAIPRHIERVPAGAHFSLELVLKVYQGRANDHEDHEEEYLQDCFHALQMLQDDYLGGQGSRGSGQVNIRIEKITRRSQQFYLGKEKSEELSLEKLGAPADLNSSTMPS